MDITEFVGRLLFTFLWMIFNLGRPDVFEQVFDNLAGTFADIFT